MASTLDIALEYASRGCAVVPIWKAHGNRCGCRRGPDCDRPGKHPRTRHGVSAASSDEKRIRSWKWETANIAIATGERSGLVVLDVDPRNRGHIELCKLVAQHGKLSEGPTAFTGGKGLHLFFRHPGCELRGQAAQGVDVKSDGGYVVAPLSLHANGRTYKWLRGLDSELPSLPRKWIEHLSRRIPEPPRTTQGTHGTQGTQEPPAAVPLLVFGFSGNKGVEQIAKSCIPSGPGDRNDALVSLVRKLKAVPELADRPDSDLLPIFEVWYVASLPYLGAPDRLTYWGKFCELWAWCKVPWGSQAIGPAIERARSGIGPAIAEKLGIEDERQRLLMRLCRELQRDWGAKPFFLAARTAGDVIGVHFTTAATWLTALRAFDVLRLVRRGERGTGASDWMYLPPLDE